MRRMVLVMAVLCATVSLPAQTLSEWFDQKKTQIEYLVNQIGALEVYTSSLEKGYDLAHTGLTAIHNIKKSDLSLHSEYFTSLSKVSPQIKGYWKIADIIQTEGRIVRTCSNERTLLAQAGLFTGDEFRYCTSVFNNLLNGCEELIDQLTELLADGKLQMKDDERLGRIDAVHAAMKDREKFVLSFLKKTKMLALQRAKESHDINMLRRLNGVQ